VALAALALTACGSDRDGGGNNGPGTTTTTIGSAVTTTAPPTTTSAPPADEELRVTVRGGDVVGGVRRFTVDVGASVLVRVEADVQDEVHVHGYDLTADVGPGTPATIRFQADIPGVFEIELEQRALRIAELAVQ